MSTEEKKEEKATGELKYVPMAEIYADSDFNCRGVIPPIDVVDLAKDILTRGLIQPVTVVRQDDDEREATGKDFKLLAGFRRHMAHVINKSETIPAIIKPGGITALDARLINLSENLQRKDLTMMQEARAIEKLKDLGISDHTAGPLLGKSRGWAQVRYMLLDLPVEVQQEVTAGYLNQANIRDIYSIHKVGSKEACYEAVRQIKDAKLQGRSISVSPHKKSAKSKRIRTRSEMFEMQETIQKALGNNFATRTLAWAAGEITNMDYYQTIQSFALDKGIDFEIPKATLEGIRV